MNFSTTTPAMPLESCQSLTPFNVESETAGPSNHVSTTPPLLSYKIAPELHIKTARKPIELQPTEIRLNRVNINIPASSIYLLKHYNTFFCRVLEVLISQKRTELFWILVHQI